MRKSRPTTPVISDTDRFSFTLLGAIALHALIILGVGFDYLSSRANASSTIEVLLVSASSTQVPEKAQAIANANQQASGRLEQADTPKQKPKTQRAQSNANEQTSNQNSSVRKPVKSQQVIHADKSSIKTASTRQAPSATKQPPAISQDQSTNDELERLVSELTYEEERYAKRPRINHIDTLSAKTAVEAEYVKDWVKKVELVGNINYPSAAKKQGLSGQLVMSVLINNDGSIVQTDLHSSSGFPILDNTAKKVVKLAQPYRKFPDEMRKEYDQLMITRTWVFQSNNTLTSH